VEGDRGGKEMTNSNAEGRLEDGYRRNLPRNSVWRRHRNHSSSRWADIKSFFFGG
jgi:hypothetical protein